MKRIAILIPVLLILAACGGVEQVNTNINVPEIDSAQYNDVPYKEGWNSLKAGKPGDAIEFFQQSNVADEKLYVGFGYAFLAQNKLNLAKRNFEKSLQINPDNLHAHFGLATMYELLHEVDAAFGIYSKLRTKFPENSWVKVHYDNIKTTETQKYLEQAEEFKKQASSIQYIQALRRASHYSPEMLDIEIRIADFYNEQLQYDIAARHYENVLEKQPDNEDILRKLADVYENAKKFDSSVVIYRKLLEIRPGDITYINKINDLKVKFYDLNLPEKFKNIFFKKNINREELAALIGHYFDRFLDTRPPVIITDIAGSFAKEQIIRICTLRIMKVRPDHSFDRFPTIDRASFARVLDNLIRYLEREQGRKITFTPLGEIIEARDISPLHKHYNTIKFLVNSQLIKLDTDNNFNPTLKVTPAEVLVAIRKILNSIDEKP